MKVWLYYANAGGGHRGPAEAIAEEFERRFKTEVTVRFIDLAETSWFLRLFLEQGYAFSVHSAEWLYAFLFELSKFRVISFFLNAVALWMVSAHMCKLLRQDQPDIIIATHFLVGPLVGALKKECLSIPLHCVVTDPESASSVWFYYRDMHYIVASEAIKTIARRNGVSSNHINLLPPVIREKSFKKADVGAVRAKAGLAVGQKIVLLVGGANGFPNVEKVLLALLLSDLSAQFVVVCGKNNALQKRIERLAATATKRVVVYGYVDFLPALISLADVVITKAGANTIFEILLQNKTLVITHYIWGQEKGNVDFVVRSKVGFYEPRSERIAALVKECLVDKKIQLALSKARQEINLQNGTSQVVDLLLKSVSNREK